MRVLIVEARFYPEISDALYIGATHALDVAGVTSDRVSVSGALEIPAAIKLAALTQTLIQHDTKLTRVVEFSVPFVPFRS